jgi:curved DNA-binding protein CbpA
MDIKRCFQILELDPDATVDEVKQAYRDLVNIWHPDRFSTSPRLRDKAEAKLKELNEAHETLISLLSPSSQSTPRGEKTAPGSTQAGDGIKQGYGKAESKPGTTEAVVEAGTFAFLKMWSYLSTKLRGILSEQVQAFREGAQLNARGTDQARAQGIGKGKGRGRGFGAKKSGPKGRGMGRGRGRGRGKGAG